MIPVIFNCKKCNPSKWFNINGIVEECALKDSSVELLIKTECHNQGCEESKLSRLQMYKIEYFFYMGSLYLHKKQLLEAVIYFNLAYENLMSVTTSIFLTDNRAKLFNNNSPVTLGAFATLCLKILKYENTNIFLNYMRFDGAAFRNDCVHNGKIPIDAEVKKYAKAIYENTVLIFNKIRKTKEFKEWSYNDLITKYHIHKESIITDYFIFYIDSNDNEKSFDKAYKNFQQRISAFKENQEILVKQENKVTTIILSQENLITKEQYKDAIH